MKFKILLKFSLTMGGLLLIFLAVLFPILHLQWDIYVDIDSAFLFIAGILLFFISCIISNDVKEVIPA